MNWLSELLNKWSCRHDWEELHTIKVYNDGEYDMPVKRKYIYKCKKCGKFKKIEIS